MPQEVARRHWDAAIARIAARQHGVLSLLQMRRLGISESAVSDRVAARRLHRVHRAVYAVGHPNLSQEGQWMAAVLACGAGAVLSHRSAGALWRIHPQPSHAAAASHPVDVMVPGNGGRAKRRGVNLHRSETLRASECTRRLGIPVTTPARTLQDLKRLLPQRQMTAALREAEFLRLPIGIQFVTDGTRSELESQFLTICRRRRLPQPVVNARVGGYVVDFLWPKHELIVEVDGWHAHRSRSAFEADRARDTRLKTLGYEVIRFTWRQITSDPRSVARTIRSLLGV